PGVTQYKFIVTKMPEGSATTIDRSTNYFTFNMIPGYVPGGRYSVRVSTYTKNDWSVSSDACTVFAPGGTPNKAEVESPVSTTAFTAVASPNPFALDFAIRVNTAGEDQVQFRVYDMLGKVVESRSVGVSELEGQHIGSNYPSGVYNVVVTQGENVKTLRVIKR
ncbi:T9SS type A sorting domain-containing protein, partial [Flavobacterium noncentrifugens]